MGRTKTGEHGENRAACVDIEGQINDLLELGRTLEEEVADPAFGPEAPGWGVERHTIPKRDAWIEHHLRIREKRGEVALIRLNKAQREYLRGARGAKKNIVLKARQVGMTTYIAGRLFVQTISHKGMLTMLVAHNREAAEEIFRIVHRFWNNLEDELRTGALKTSRSSARELVFPHMDSEFTVTSAGDNAGRGRTIQNLHCTEVSRWGNDAEEALASLRAAVVPNGEIVLESTANGAWGPFYQEWQQAEETGYTKHFFPWWFEESYAAEPATTPLLLTEEETALVKEHGLSARQIAWRRQEWARLRGLAPQEFAEDAVTCFRASGECVFDVGAIEKALGRVTDPVAREFGGMLSIWLTPQAGKEYVIGVDPAGGGVRGDYSCAEVIDQRSGIQCAELVGHLTPRELAKAVAQLGKRYNLAWLGVERNNHGNGVLAHLERDEYPKIYTHDSQAGWYTSTASRPKMIEAMVAAVADSPELFLSARLWNECRTFVRHEHGTGAASGSHDDCVMAMAVALVVREEKAKEIAEAKAKEKARQRSS